MLVTSVAQPNRVEVPRIS